jgi:hypothetical protein
MPTLDKTVSEERIRSSGGRLSSGFSGFTNARSELAEKIKERVLLATERSEQIRKIIETGVGTG